MSLNLRPLILLSILPIVACTSSHKSKNASIVKIDNKTLSDRQFLLGEIKSLNGDRLSAIDHFRASIIYTPNAKIYQRLANEYFEAGEIELATRTAETSLSLNKNSDVLILLGNLYAISGNIKKAQEYFIKASAYDPSAYLYLSVIYEKQGDFEKSELLLKKSIKKSSKTRHIAYYKLANLYLYIKGKPERAKKYFENAISEDIDFIQPVLSLHDIYKKEGKFKKAIEVLSDFQKLSTNNIEISSKLAELHLARGHYSKAFYELARVRTVVPDNLHIPTKMGLILVEQKKYSEANAFFEDILKKDPESDSTKFYLGVVNEELGLKQKAADYYLQISSKSTYYEDAIVHAARLLKLQNKVDLAIVSVETALAVAGTTKMKLVYTNLLATSGQLEEAITFLETELLSNKDKKELFYALGTIYDLSGDKQKTIENMNKVIKLDPKNEEALNYIAYTYAEMDTNLELALELVLKALNLNPSDGYIKDTYGFILYKQGKFDEATKVLEQAHMLEPKEAIILEHLADAYQAQDNFDKALNMYFKALQNETDKDSIIAIKAKINQLQKKSSSESIATFFD